MRKKKTIQIEDVKKRVNDFLKDSKDSMKSERESMAMFLESILMDTGNYKGFGYISKGNMIDSKEGTTFGIQDQSIFLSEEDWFKGTDSSRVFYY